MVEKIDFLRHVNPENYFFLQNGFVIKSLPELVNVIDQIDDTIFNHHVTTERNDFANWIETTVGDVVLKNQILNADNKLQFLDILNKRIEEIKLNIDHADYPELTTFLDTDDDIKFDIPVEGELLDSFLVSAEAAAAAQATTVQPAAQPAQTEQQAAPVEQPPSQPVAPDTPPDTAPELPPDTPPDVAPETPPNTGAVQTETPVEQSAPPAAEPPAPEAAPVQPAETSPTQPAQPEAPPSQPAPSEPVQQPATQPVQETSQETQAQPTEAPPAETQSPDAPAEGTPVQPTEAPVEQLPETPITETPPAEQPAPEPAQEAPSEQPAAAAPSQPAEQAPVEPQAPAEQQAEAPIEEMPAQPQEETPAETPSVDSVPEETQVEEPKEEAPVEESPAEGQTDDKPAEEVPTDEQLSEENKEEKPVEESEEQKAGEENPEENKTEEGQEEKPKEEIKEEETVEIREIEKFPVGVAELDAIFTHGIPKICNMLFVGEMSTGKTITALNLILSKAKNGGKSIYISYQDSEEKIINVMKGFDQKILDYINSGNILVKKIDPFEIAKVVHVKEGEHELINLGNTMDFVEEFKPDLIVMDSLSTLELSFPEGKAGYREYVDDLFKYFEKKDVIAVFIKELKKGEQTDKEFFENILADIILHFERGKNTHQIKLVKDYPIQTTEEKKGFFSFFKKKK